jgi:hypothetical protein
MLDHASSLPTPSLLQSAQASLQGGFQLLDKGASEIVAGTTGSVQQPGPGVILTSRLTNGTSDAPDAIDPTLQGIFDTLRAKGQVEAGAALLHVYNRTRDDLFSLIAPDTTRN